MTSEPKLYEISCLVRKESEAAAQELMEKLKNYIEEKNGRSMEEPRLTKKMLSYPIRRDTEAYSGGFRFFLRPEEVKTLEEIVKQDKNVLRYALFKSAIAAVPSRPLVRKTKRLAEKKTADIAEIDKKLEEILGT